MADGLLLTACGVGLGSRSLLGSVSRLELGGDSQGRRANWSCMVCAIDVRHGSPPQSMPALLRLLAINNRYREASIKISVDCTPLLVSMRKRKLHVAPCYSVAHSRCNAKGQSVIFPRIDALPCTRYLSVAPLNSTSLRHLSTALLRGTSQRHFAQ